MKRNIITKLRIREAINIMFCVCFITIFCKSAWIALPIFIKEPDLFYLELIMAYVYSIWNLYKNVVELFIEAGIRGTSDEGQSH